jgi:hypothetical protein
VRGRGRGPDGRHAFEPSRLLRDRPALPAVLRNASRDPHHFTSDEFAARIFARKAQVTQRREDGRETAPAEFKGAVREIEAYPGHAAGRWFVPVAAGKAADLRCGVAGADGRTRAEHGMAGGIVIE